MNTHDRPLWTPGAKLALGGLLGVQFLAATVIGTGELLRNDGLAPVPPIAITAVAPVAAFLAACALSSRFRGFALAQDIRILTMIQLWRVVGFVFLGLYAFGTLPGLFALPAGAGDVAVGIAAFFVAKRLLDQPSYARASGFVWFNILGLGDFAVAILTAGLAGGAFPGLIANGITSAPMEVWPLNIFPSFIVPAFIILHLTVLAKVVALRRIHRERAGSALVTA